jgi:hypothetical protein
MAGCVGAAAAVDLRLGSEFCRDDGRHRESKAS